MNKSFDDARLAVQKAREALRNNDRSTARQLAEQAAALAPKMEDPWLILAAVASPRASLDYVQTALKLDPNSPRAQRALQWAMQRLNDPQGQGLTPEQRLRAQSTKPADQPSVAQSSVHDPTSGIPPNLPQRSSPEKSVSSKKPRRTSLFPILLLGLGVLVCALAAWSASSSPVVAGILKQPAVEPTQQHSWAQVSIPKPTYTPGAPSAQTVFLQATATPFSASTDVPSVASTDIPTGQPTDMAAVVPTGTSIPTAEPTWSGSLSLAYVPDTPTAVDSNPTNAPAAAKAPSLPPVPGDAPSNGVHWIDVDLTHQMVYAYAGNTVVNSFLVSTGTWDHPTVTGKYHIYVKLRYTDMSGPDYYLPNVPFTMYFYEGYGLHGTYWHHNFGTPMSHGCVNLATPDAEWLYGFSSVGTLVNVHY